MTLDRIQSTADAPYLDVFADALTEASYKRATIQHYLGAAAHPKSLSSCPNYYAESGSPV